MMRLLIILNIAQAALLLWILRGNYKRSSAIKKSMDELKTQVENTKGVEASAATLLKGLHDRLVAAGTDPAQLAAIASDLKGSSDALAAAVAANAE